MVQKEVSFQYAPFVIEVGKIKEFAQAIGLENSIYYDLEAAKSAGFRDIPIPSTF